MKKIVELVFRAYKEKESTIQRGFITQQNIDWVTDHLMLKYLSDKELSEMWFVVHDYFTNEMAEYDENKEIIGWKPNKSFERDTESAWLEVINLEARRRKELQGGN
jgi:hypothetical protein